MRVWLASLYESLRSSLFWVPAFYALVAIGLSAFTTAVDAHGFLAPLSSVLFEANADAVRSVLQTVATAAITVTGLVFPAMVVALQLASSQFSPRVLRGFLRDPVVQHAIGVVTGTFIFSVIMLASSPVQQATSPERAGPSLAVTLSVVLAVASVLVIVWFIHHSARYMQVVEIINRTTAETRALIAQLLPAEGDKRAPGRLRESAVPDGDPHVVHAPKDGWVQQIDTRALVERLPPGSVVRLDTRPGLFVMERQSLCTLWLANTTSDEADEAAEADGADGPGPEWLDGLVAGAFAIGATRTMQQDVVFGIRQIVDIALRALSPAVNDPTTAYEATVNLGAILRDILGRDLPARVDTDDDGRTLMRPHELTHAEFVSHAFDQLRLAAARHPVAATNLLDTLGTLVGYVREHRRDEHVPVLHDQISLVVESVEAQRPLEADLDRVREVARRARDATRAKELDPTAVDT